VTLVRFCLPRSTFDAGGKRGRNTPPSRCDRLPHPARQSSGLVDDLARYRQVDHTERKHQTRYNTLQSRGAGSLRGGGDQGDHSQLDPARDVYLFQDTEIRRGTLRDSGGLSPSGQKASQKVARERRTEAGVGIGQEGGQPYRRTRSGAFACPADRTPPNRAVV